MPQAKKKGKIHQIFDIYWDNITCINLLVLHKLNISMTATNQKEYEGIYRFGLTFDV